MGASAAGSALTLDAPLAPAFGAGDLLPYHDEYSNELRNSFFSPQTLQRPSLTAPLGGSITQWCTQPLSETSAAGSSAVGSSAVGSSAVVTFFFADDDGLI